MTGAPLAGRYGLLRDILRAVAPGLIAVSGGVDSRLLAHAAKATALPFQAVYFLGPHQSPGEADYALDWLRGLGLPFHVIPLSPLDDAAARANTRERCYHCKRALFRRAADLARDLSGEGTYLRLLDGSNAEDAASFRPGLRALRECGVQSPLAKAGLDKAAIRQLARDTGLAWPDQPSRACLMTRFAYGIAPTPDLLALVGRAEDALYALGFASLRVRVPRLTPLDPATPDTMEPGTSDAPVFQLHLARSEHALYHTRQADVAQALASAGIAVREVRFLDALSGVYDTPENDAPLPTGPSA